jgi:hypothetical protein
MVKNIIYTKGVGVWVVYFIFTHIKKWSIFEKRE